jgi:hypothetical protein
MFSVSVMFFAISSALYRRVSVFLKLEADISGYRRQHIIDSLFYSNFKLKFPFLKMKQNFIFIFVMKQIFLMKVYFYRVCC